jgi:D-alanyl-D-alanine carboxypeptidase
VVSEYSYNGWPASSNKAAINIVPFGDPYGLPFPGGVRDGDVKKVLGYVCTQLHYRVEKCVSGWDWGYSYRANVNNPSTLSCHASGTAVDYNAPNHPNGVYGTWTAEQKATVYDILAEVGGAVQWGEDYTGTIDGMHFEIIVDADYLAEIAASLPDGVDPAPAPEPEDIPMSLSILRGPDGVDYGYTEDMSFFMRIPTEAYYNNLAYCGIIQTPHGQGLASEQNIVDWLRDEVGKAGGRVYMNAE